MRHRPAEELHGIVLFLMAIWVAYFAGPLLPFDPRSWGLQPRTVHGLVGIVTMPFLHLNLAHLLANTVPLFVLLSLLAGSQARSWEIVIDTELVGGVLLWLFGRPAIHIGASGLVFGLTAFLIISGFLERRMLAILVALLVIFLYGGTLLWSIIPRPGSIVSWDGHLFGAIGGLCVAFARAPSAKMLGRSEQEYPREIEDQRFKIGDSRAENRSREK